MFFEVPNNLFKINFTNRPYDFTFDIFQKGLEKFRINLNLKFQI